MSEELYNSSDYCSLAEQYEELKKENAELARDKDYLMNLFMERSEYVFNVVANMKIESLTQKCKALEADYEVSNREMLIMQSELGRLKSELARRDEELALTEKKLCNIDRSARAEIDRLNAEIKTTDDLLKEATDNNKRSKWKAYVPGWGAPAVNKRYLVKLINDWITIATYYLRVGGGYWKDDRGQELADGVVSLWKGLEE